MIMRNEKRTYTLGYGITMEKFEKKKFLTDNQQLTICTICTIQLLSSSILSKYMTNPSSQSREKKEENNDTGLSNLGKGAVILGVVYKVAW